MFTIFRFGQLLAAFAFFLIHTPRAHAHNLCFDIFSLQNIPSLKFQPKDLAQLEDLSKAGFQRLRAEALANPAPTPAESLQLALNHLRSGNTPATRLALFNGLKYLVALALQPLLPNFKTKADIEDNLQAGYARLWELTAEFPQWPGASTLTARKKVLWQNFLEDFQESIGADIQATGPQDEAAIATALTPVDFDLVDFSKPIDDKKIQQLISRLLVSRLTAREERILRLHYFHAMTLPQIAEELGLSSSRVHVIFDRAQRKLQYRSSTDIPLYTLLKNSLDKPAQGYPPAPREYYDPAAQIEERRQHEAFLRDAEIRNQEIQESILLRHQLVEDTLKKFNLTAFIERDSDYHLSAKYNPTLNAAPGKLKREMTYFRESLRDLIYDLNAYISRVEYFAPKPQMQMIPPANLPRQAELGIAHIEERITTLVAPYAELLAKAAEAINNFPNNNASPTN